MFAIEFFDDLIGQLSGKVFFTESIHKIIEHHHHQLHRSQSYFLTNGGLFDDLVGPALGLEVCGTGYLCLSFG